MQGITPDKVYDKAVQYAAGRTFALGALIYRKQQDIPGDAHPQASFGNGYAQVVRSAGRDGVMVDLADLTSRSSNAEARLESTADRIVEALAEVTNEAVGTHTRYHILDRNGKKISFKRLATKYEYGEKVYDMQVYVNGEDRKCVYTPNNSMSLLKPSSIRF